MRCVAVCIPVIVCTTLAHLRVDFSEKLSTMNEGVHKKRIR